MTIRIEPDEYKYLQDWASREFLSTTQLAKVILKKAIAKDRDQNQKAS